MRCLPGSLPPRGGSPVRPVTGSHSAAAQRLHELRHVLPVLGRQFVDASDQQVPLPVARRRLPAPGLVVVMQAGRFGGGGAAPGARAVKSLGKWVDGLLAWRADAV